MICCMYARSKETSGKLTPSMSYQSYNYNPFGQLRMTTIKFKGAKPATNALNNISPYVNPCIKWVQEKSMSTDSTTITLVNNITAAALAVYVYDDGSEVTEPSLQPVQYGGSQQFTMTIPSSDMYSVDIYYDDFSEDQCYQTAIITVNGTDYLEYTGYTFPANGFLSLPITVTLNPS